MRNCISVFAHFFVFLCIYYLVVAILFVYLPGLASSALQVIDDMFSTCEDFLWRKNPCGSDQYRNTFSSLRGDPPQLTFLMLRLCFWLHFADRLLSNPRRGHSGCGINTRINPLDFQSDETFHVDIKFICDDCFSG